jgi:hypothetical protein
MDECRGEPIIAPRTPMQRFDSHANVSNIGELLVSNWT